MGTFAFSPGPRLPQGPSSAARPARSVADRGSGKATAGAGHQNLNAIAAAGIQARLRIAAVDDPHEREADRLAARALGTAVTDRTQTTSLPPPPRVTPFAATGESSVARFTRHNPESQPAAPGEALAARLQQRQGGGVPLAGATRTFMESRFGADFRAVRIHDDGEAAHLSSAVQARAFTRGSDIYFNTGEYAPERSGGRQLLAHELVHTLQQQPAGAAAPAVQRWPWSKGYQEIGMLKVGGLGKDMVSGVHVPYMNETDRLQYLLTVRNGLLYKADGSLLDTTHVANHMYIFVMDKNGRIFSADKLAVAHHSSFMSGRPVAAAGHIRVVQGALEYVNNQSGHYAPTKDYLDQFVKELKKQKVDFTDVELELGSTKKQVKKRMKARGMNPFTRLYTPALPKEKYY